MESLQDVHHETRRTAPMKLESALIALDGFGGWAMCFNTAPPPAGTAPEIPDNVLPGLEHLSSENTEVVDDNGLLALDGFGGWATCLNEPPMPFDVTDVPVNAIESVTLIEQTLTLEESS